MLGATRIVAAVLVCCVTACGSSAEPTAATITPQAQGPSTEGAFHAVPADAVAVSGTAECILSYSGTDPEGGSGLLVSCELDLTDPRVSGDESHDRFRFLVKGRGGTVWQAEDAAISNDGGTWRGTVQAAEDTAGIPTGEAHYLGEGAYEGLEFHYYFFHANLSKAAEVRGWVYETGE
jgi:hypothetical protein